jgi:hypothetical protein
MIYSAEGLRTFGIGIKSPVYSTKTGDLMATLSFACSSPVTLGDVWFPH